jgi:MFS family permease
VQLRILRPLRHRDFRLLWLGQTISLFGNGLYAVALPFQVLALGGSALQLGAAFTVFTGTQVLLTLVAGVVVDRLPRRTVILGTDLVSGCAVLGLAALGSSGRLRLADIYAVAAVLGAAAALYLPALSAIVPDLLPEEVLLSGNALRALSRQASRVLGPAVGGLIVTGSSPSAAFALDAATFFISFGIFLAARSTGKVGGEEAPLRSQLLEGLRFTFSVRWIAATIVTFGLGNLFFNGSLIVGLPLLVTRVLRGGAALFGGIAAAGGVGELLASLWIGSFRPRRPGVVMYLAMLLSSLALAAFGLIPVIAAVVLAEAVFAAGLVIANTLWYSALQAAVPRRLLGRVSSVDWFGSLVIGVPAPLLGGVVLAATNPRVLFIGSGLSAAAVVLAVSRLGFIGRLGQSEAAAEGLKR